MGVTMLNNEKQPAESKNAEARDSGGAAQGRERSGAEMIVEQFLAQQIERLFVFPGGTIGPVLDVANRVGLPIITARHEQGAGYAALAEARLKQRAQVVMVTSGPGVTNVVTVVADAYFDSTPLVVLTGQVGTGDLERSQSLRQRGFQEVDTLALMRPISKAQFLPQSVEELAACLPQAFALAESGRPGPVVVDLPMNVQRGSARLEPVEAARPEPANGEIEPKALDQALQWLRDSKRPLIIAGQGVLLSGAVELLRRWVEMSATPVTHSLMGLGAIPADSPYCLGFHGHTGNQTAGMAIQHADCILVLGSRLDVRQTGSLCDQFAPQARVIRAEIDPAEIDHARVHVELTFKADVKQLLRSLLGSANGYQWPDRGEWMQRIQAWRERFPLGFERDGLLKPQEVVETIARVSAGKKVIAVSGVGSHQQWAARHFDFDFPHRRWLSSGGHGAMGYDLPSAAGAQFAEPDALVVCLVGDGSLQINLQELGTLAFYRLPVKVVVLDNQRLGIVSQFQLQNWAADPSCGSKWNPDFCHIARAYGIHAISVDNRDEIEVAVADMLDHDGPVLLHCHVDPKSDIEPMLLAGQDLAAMWPYSSV